MEIDYTIAMARPEHLVVLADIELAAATMLQGYAPASVLEETIPRAKLIHAQQEERLWIALFKDIPVGFALVEMLAEDLPHLLDTSN